jgi:hypothetical protein
MEGKQQLAEKTGIGFLSFGMAVGLVGLIGMGAVTAAPNGPGIRTFDTGGGLSAFHSEKELRDFLRRLQKKRLADLSMAPPSIVAMNAPPPPQEEASAADQISVTAARVAQPGITNNQEASVDEGGIVKVHGDHLVILRRGRLFTVSTAGGGLRPVDSINAFPPGVYAGGDWYDEMLVSGDRVVVVGYSYERGGTEINRFRIGADGRLRFEDAYHLRSNDYYSSRNYASRLIGDKLVYYTPLYLNSADDPFDALPAMRRWRGRSQDAFKPIIGARQVYVLPTLRRGGELELDTLHSVVSCDLAAPTLDCAAKGVLGPASRTFYVSGQAVYLWMSDAWSGQPGRASAMIYRMPFGAEQPRAIGARGAPVDQFSFREDAAEGMLNVLVRAEGGGDAMWRPEVSEGAVALLRLPLDSFGDGSREAPLSRYRPLPSPQGPSWNFHNRFVGAHLLYGAGDMGEGPERRGHMLVAAPVLGGAPQAFTLPHSVDRIEALGRDALVVGGGGSGDLNFSAIELGRGSARLGSRYVQPAAAEGETRSHAFFFNPDPRTPGGESGLLGLPVNRRVEPAYHRFFGSAASMLFLRRDDRRFAPAGELDARLDGVADDGCQASCVDWYGNARPIFLRGRVFALLGYELVEGGLDGRTIREVRRINFAPRMAARERRTG